MRICKQKGETIKLATRLLFPDARRQCKECLEEKHPSKFGKYVGSNGKYYKSWRCKQCQLAKNKRWQKANPDRVSFSHRSMHLRREYGITRREYDELLKAQNGVCAICKKPETRKSHGKNDPLSVDHNHDTGVVRGLLCGNCNRMIGLAFDDPETLRLAAEYLEASDNGS
jgi:hypothetical protein